MRLCQCHWEELKAKTLGKNWMMAGIIMMQQLTNDKSLMAKYGSIFKLQTYVDSKGGCIVCTFGQDYMDKPVAEINVQ